MEEYVDALLQEASQAPIRKFETLYMGGGTPSLLPPDLLKKLIVGLVENFGSIDQFEESTFEANPESLNKEKLIFLKSVGFNRLSIGLQSFHNCELKTLGRVHSQDDFLRAYKAAREAGLQNINVDLIAGIPSQTLESFLTSLAAVLKLEPEHLSVYGLQIEAGTPFFERGIVCDQLLMRQMLEKARACLMANGFHHYEISNFARPGFESKHNMHYWQYGEYIGLGSVAASFVQGVRRQNIPGITDYIARIKTGKSPISFQETLPQQAREGEKLLLALRQLDGTKVSEKQRFYFLNEIEKHIQNGLLIREGEKVKLSEEGLYLANEVFCSFVAPFEEL